MKILKFVFYKVAFSLSIVIILPLLLCIFVFLYKDTTTLIKMVFYVKTGFIVLWSILVSNLMQMASNRSRLKKNVVIFCSTE